ncbi:TMEM175 family protein [Bifidobacterium cuniculi]|nr:TMEM175 family protein [Bifidobacterium cuniculi]
MRREYFAYTLSFAWLGTMWAHQHNMWHDVHKISMATVRWALAMLFFSSWFPYSTSFVESHFNETTAQVFYGVIVLLVTIANMFLSHSLASANPDDTTLTAQIHEQQAFLSADLAVKCIGLALAFIYPPAMMISIIVAALIISVGPYLRKGPLATAHRQ